MRAQVQYAFAKDKGFVMVSGARVSGRGTSVGDVPGSTSFYSYLASALDIPVLVVQDMVDKSAPGSRTDAPGTGRSLGRTQKADVADRCANG